MTLPSVLLIDDSPDDADFLRRVFSKNGIENPLVWVEEGYTALEQMRRQEIIPALILLDLNLPGLEGREVLNQLKQDAELRSIPVVVLTTSNHPRDIQNCYAAGANSFHQKPADFPQFEQMVLQLSHYWLRSAILPRSASLPVFPPISERRFAHDHLTR